MAAVLIVFLCVFPSFFFAVYLTRNMPMYFMTRESKLLQDVVQVYSCSTLTDNVLEWNMCISLCEHSAGDRQIDVNPSSKSS